MITNSVRLIHVELDVCGRHAGNYSRTRLLALRFNCLSISLTLCMRCTWYIVDRWKLMRRLKSTVELRSNVSVQYREYLSTPLSTPKVSAFRSRLIQGSPGCGRRVFGFVGRSSQTRGREENHRLHNRYHPCVWPGRSTRLTF